MIIIKSQDGRRIFETEDIELSLNNIWVNDVYNDVGESQEVKIATYESEERANEVMEEIEEHIREAFVTEKYVKLASFEAGTDSIQEVMLGLQENMAKLAIYPMPKE